VLDDRQRSSDDAYEARSSAESSRSGVETVVGAQPLGLVLSLSSVVVGGDGCFLLASLLLAADTVVNSLGPRIVFQ